MGHQRWVYMNREQTKSAVFKDRLSRDDQNLYKLLKKTETNPTYIARYDAVDKVPHATNFEFHKPVEIREAKTSQPLCTEVRA